jgi:phosphonate transport system substrate-binding protein
MVPKTRHLTFLSVLAAACLKAMLLPGCSQENGYTRIDFSNTVSVESPHSDRKDRPQIRVAVAAMVSPKETLKSYKALLDYMGTSLNLDIQLVQRKTYREINELFEKRGIDLAFICTGPYVRLRERLGIDALATPIVRDQPFYQSYLIVHKDSPFHSLEDLQKHRFAFTDPDSNTGALVPYYWLSLMGERPSSFFSHSTYTYSHDNSIMAVARSLVDGAAVDGHQWEYYHLRNPQYTRLTRVIKKSERFGNPPLVAAADLAPETKAAIQQILLGMHQDPAGKRILDPLLIDRFEIPQEQWYTPVQEMYSKTQAAR